MNLTQGVDETPHSGGKRNPTPPNIQLSLKDENISGSEFSAIQDLVCVGGIAEAQRGDITLKDYFLDLHKNQTIFFLDDKQI